MEKETKFLQKLGYVVERVSYIQWVDNDRYGEDEFIDRNVLVAYSSLELGEIEDIKLRTSRRDSYHGNPLSEYDIIKVFKREFEIALYNLVYKSL